MTVKFPIVERFRWNVVICKHMKGWARPNISWDMCFLWKVSLWSSSYINWTPIGLSLIVANRMYAIFLNRVPCTDNYAFSWILELTVLSAHIRTFLFCLVVHVRWEMMPIFTVISKVRLGLFSRFFEIFAFVHGVVEQLVWQGDKSFRTNNNQLLVLTFFGRPAARTISLLIWEAIVRCMQHERLIVSQWSTRRSQRERTIN